MLLVRGLRSLRRRDRAAPRPLTELTDLLGLGEQHFSSPREYNQRKSSVTDDSDTRSGGEIGIRYDRYFFDGPVPISTWAPPDRAGVYAILVPGQLGPDLVYFGESGNLSRLRKFRHNPKYPCWLEKAGSEEYVLVAFHLAPQSTRGQRRAIRKRLIAQYRPTCNEV